jgi:hypothetical protein
MKFDLNVNGPGLWAFCDAGDPHDVKTAAMHQSSSSRSRFARKGKQRDRTWP